MKHHTFVNTASKAIFLAALETVGYPLLECHAQWISLLLQTRTSAFTYGPGWNADKMREIMSPFYLHSNLRTSKNASINTFGHLGKWLASFWNTVVVCVTSLSVCIRCNKARVVNLKTIAVYLLCTYKNLFLFLWGKLSHKNKFLPEAKSCSKTCSCRITIHPFSWFKIDQQRAGAVGILIWCIL